MRLSPATPISEQLFKGKPLKSCASFLSLYLLHRSLVLHGRPGDLSLPASHYLLYPLKQASVLLYRKDFFQGQHYLHFEKYLWHSKQVPMISNQLLDLTLTIQRCTKRGFWERSSYSLFECHSLQLATGGSDIKFYGPNSTAKLWLFQTKQSLRIKLGEQICNDFSD